MPCSDNMPTHAETVRQHERRIDKITRLLCSVCREAQKQQFPVPKEVAIWYLQHEEQDRLRAEAEERRLTYEKEQRRKQYEELREEFDEMG